MPTCSFGRAKCTRHALLHRHPLCSNCKSDSGLFDRHLAPHHGQRRIVDTKWATHNAYVFFAADPLHHTCVWIQSFPDEIHTFEVGLQEKPADLIPVLEGFCLHPVECTGHLGILALRPCGNHSQVICPHFLKDMEGPPYHLPVAICDIPDADIPTFEMPGTPEDPPPLSDSHGSVQVQRL